MQTENDPFFEERRRLQRCDISLPAQILLRYKTIKGTVINISEIGIGILLHEKVDVSDEFDLDITFPLEPDGQKKIQVKVIVVWIENESREGLFRAGLSIIDSSEENTSILRELVKKIQQKG
ncbi:MAG: PilZ domain-containing protein [Candidatus Aureabacteria bacterium]|nr:PilZ domain-containing protein [Candidatus Auribacterota bacterium]